MRKWAFVVCALGFACSPNLIIWPELQLSDVPLFRFYEGKTVGFLDATGRVAIPAKHSGSIDDDGFFDGRWVSPDGIVDERGRMVKLLPGVHDAHSRYSEGLIGVREGQREGFADRNGKIVVGLQFESTRPFSEGLSAVKVNGRWGYIDHAGNFAIAPYLFRAEPFVEGAARVITGQECMPVPSGPCGERAIAGPRGCEEVFIDKRGLRLTAQRYRYSHDFSEGLAAVSSNGLQWGYMDRSGTLRIPMRFGLPGRFSEGLASFYQDGKSGYIDTQGRVAIPAKFSRASAFSKASPLSGNGATNISSTTRGHRSSAASASFKPPDSSTVWR